MWELFQFFLNYCPELKIPRNLSFLMPHGQSVQFETAPRSKRIQRWSVIFLVVYNYLAQVPLTLIGIAPNGAIILLTNYVKPYLVMSAMIKKLLDDDMDDSLNDLIVKLETDASSIFNGTKYKLIANKILCEPLLKKKKVENEVKINVKNDNEPSTSAACFEWRNDGMDGMLFDRVTLEENLRNSPKICTKAEISHKRNVARIRLADKRNNRIKNEIAVFFWAIEKWPAFAVEILFSTNFGYNERLTLATFFHGNGLVCPALPVLILQFYNRNAVSRDWKQKLYKFEKLFQFLDKTKDTTDPQAIEMSKKYYFYSMINKHMIYYDGNKRNNGQPEQFVRCVKW